jgi:hypothetical protein
VSRMIRFGTLFLVAIAGALAASIAGTVGATDGSGQPAAVPAAGGGADAIVSTTGEPAPVRFAYTSRYAVLAWTDELGLRPADLFRLPPRVKALLGSDEPTAGPGSVITTRDARAATEILDRSGFDQTTFRDRSLGVVVYTRSVYQGLDINRHPVNLVIVFRPIFPPPVDERAPAGWEGLG